MQILSRISAGELDIIGVIRPVHPGVFKGPLGNIRAGLVNIVLGRTLVYRQFKSGKSFCNALRSHAQHGIPRAGFGVVVAGA